MRRPCTRNLLPALAFHGRYIERYLSTYFSPNTHLLGEAVALLFSRNSVSPNPKRRALERIRVENCAARSAAAGASRWSVLRAIAAITTSTRSTSSSMRACSEARNGIRNPPSLRRRAPTNARRRSPPSRRQGPAEGFGDDDGGRLWNPRRNRTEHMTDPLALRRGDLLARVLRRAIDRGSYLAVWKSSRGCALENTLADSEHPRPLRSVAFPDGGLYVLADSDPYAQATGRRCRSSRRGSLRARTRRCAEPAARSWMDGAGWWTPAAASTFRKIPADRNAFRGTSAHNTLRVDGAGPGRSR
jgi:hypothetical protein